MRRWTTTAGVLLALAITSPATAQSWETPTFFAPAAHDDIGFYLIDAEFGDLGFMGIWRQSGNLNFGLRGGMGGVEGNRTVLLGVEVYGPLVTPGGSSVLAVSWLAGAGASFNGATWLRVPAGVSIGARIPGSGFTITPYVHPRLALDVVSRDRPNGDEDTDSEFNLEADFGADLAFGTSWVARFGLTVGDVEAFGIGLAYRIPRGISVR
jgi:hypothetical protein